MIAHDMIDVQPIVKRMYNTLADQQTADEMYKWGKRFNEEIEIVGDLRVAILEKYCKKDKKGRLAQKDGIYQIDDKDRDNFEAEIKQALNYDVRLGDLPKGVKVAPSEIEELKRLGVL